MKSLEPEISHFTESVCMCLYYQHNMACYEHVCEIVCLGLHVWMRVTFIRSHFKGFVCVCVCYQHVLVCYQHVCGYLWVRLCVYGCMVHTFCKMYVSVSLTFIRLTSKQIIAEFSNLAFYLCIIRRCDLKHFMKIGKIICMPRQTNG